MSKKEIFMIPNSTPCIRTMSHIFNHFEWLGSLVDEISDKIEMILWCESYLLGEQQELIITSMNIPNDKSTHKKMLEFYYMKATKQVNSIFSIFESRIIKAIDNHLWSYTMKESFIFQ